MSPVTSYRGASSSSSPLVGEGERGPLLEEQPFDADDYYSLDEVANLLHKGDIGSLKLIVGVDFTRSNTWNGHKSFNGRSLHAIDLTPNQYEQVIRIVGQTLSKFYKDQDDIPIQCFGFGDELSTRDNEVFSFNLNERPCHGYRKVLDRYKELIPHLKLGGSASFAPLIEMATTHVERSGWQHHVLLIISDEQLKQQIQPTILSPSYQVRKKHKLKLSSSSSSSLPYQLKSEHEKMDKKSARKWTKEEAKYLAELSKESELDELYRTWKWSFFEIAAARLNEKFANDPNFVQFTPKNVRNRVNHSRRAYVVSEVSTSSLLKKKKVSTSSGTPAEDLFKEFGPAFQDSVKGTSLGTLSGASHARSGPFTNPATGCGGVPTYVLWSGPFTSPATGCGGMPIYVPWSGPFTSSTTGCGGVPTTGCGGVPTTGCGGAPTNVPFTPEQADAVKYLSAGNREKFSHGKELQIFTLMLCRVPHLAQSFHLMPDDYEKRSNSLINLFQHGGEGVPNIPEDELPEDFRKKPPQE